MSPTLTTILLFLCFILQSVSAQDSASSAPDAPPSPFAKGMYALSGSISYNTTTYSSGGQSTTTFNLAPSFLYFTSGKFAWGAQIVYTSHTNKSQYGESGTAVLGVGPCLRFYPVRPVPQMFVTASVYLTSMSLYTGDNSTSGPSSSYGAISVGYDIISDSMFAVEPYVEYRSRILQNSSTADGITFGVSFVSFHP